MTRRVLKHDEVCFGFRCKQGTVVDDELRSGTFANNVKVRGIELPAGSQFGTEPDFGSFWVKTAEPAKVHGHVFSAESLLEFWPPPYWSLLLAPLRPSALPGMWREIWAATVEQAVTVVPSEPLCIGTHQIHSNDRVVVGKSGRLFSWMMRAPHEVQGLSLQSGLLEFRADGTLEEVMLYQSQTVLGVPCFGCGLVGTELRFHRNGTLAQFVLAENHYVNGILYGRGSRLRMSLDGEVTQHRTIKTIEDAVRARSRR